MLRALLVSLALLFSSASALANPRVLPFTYGVGTNPKGDAEIEQYADLTPVYARDAATGKPARYMATQFQTELEYGITDALELGLYFTYAPTAGDSYTSYPVTTEGNGVKQRLRYRLADEGSWPIDVALYGELTETNQEFEIEAKIILQRRIGHLLIAANLWAEREMYFNDRREWVANPTFGIAYQFAPKVTIGAEYWLRFEHADDNQSAFNSGPHQYVGPTMLLSFGRLWWSTGFYLRASDFGRQLEPSDAFGNTWLRTIVGIQL